MRRGTPFILSAKDWALMKKWHGEGVPLPVVIEAIDSVFEKNETSGRKKVISSLSYCKHAVKELWDERKELSVGEEGTTPEVAPGERALKRMKSAPKIEARLMELEHEMVESIVEELIDKETLRAEVVRSL